MKFSAYDTAKFFFQGRRIIIDLSGHRMNLSVFPVRNPFPAHSAHLKKERP